MSKLIRGFRDIIGADADAFAALERTAREVFTSYGGVEIRIPTVEQKDLFVKATGDTTDIVQKEMYAFEDAGGRMIALRPEGTPGTIRAYIENNFAQSDPVKKFFYIGNMFRSERPQAGRYREFEQIGMESIGSASPVADAEVILMIKDIVSKFGVKKYSVIINSLGCEKCRPVYRENLIKFLQERKDTLCERCQDRLERNPLRVLDCKIDGHKVKESAPRMQLCAECGDHFTEVKGMLDGRVDYIVDTNLVRGLDYYTGTVFEFQAGDAAQNAIAGGGRYDTLIKSMGGADTPAVGFAMGVERVIAAREESFKSDKKSVAVVSLSKECNIKAFDVMQSLREAGVSVTGGLFDKSIKQQMKDADRKGSKLVLILGEDELKEGVISVKNMADGEQKQVSLNSVVAEVIKII
ncbi:histidyl-tRNA synthetase [Parelusimicrobium proximum]|uniref:histidine--tRNA ligase n=1 Tax=Parelusimicrobium proximum TaxID=3228953 RepID=UPI003D168F6F